MKTRHLLPVVVGLPIGILSAYLIKTHLVSEPQGSHIPQEQIPNLEESSSIPNSQAFKSQYEALAPNEFATRFDEIYSDDKPGKLFRCELCLAAWLKVDLIQAIKAALEKDRQKLLPDALLALRNVGTHFQEGILAFWKAEGAQYGSSFAEVVRDLCESLPEEAARIEVMLLLGIDEGPGFADSLLAADTLQTALSLIDSHGLADEESMMSVLGKLYAEEILAQGKLEKLGLSEEALMALQKAVITSVGKHNPQEALKFAARLDSDFDKGQFSFAIATAASADPSIVEDWVFEQRGDRLLAYHGVSQLLAFYASRGDSASIQRTVDRYKLEYPGRPLDPQVLADAAKMNPEIFVPMMQSMAPDALNEHRELMRDLAEMNPVAARELSSTATNKNWELVLAQAKFGDDYQGLISHLADNNYETGYIAQVLSDVGSEDPEGAWRAAMAIEDSETRPESLGALIRQILPISQDWALDAIQTMPEGPQRTGALSSLGSAFGEMDPRRGSEVLHEWKNQGVLEDSFIYSYVYAAARVDWRGALAWAAEVQDPTMRQGLTKLFIKSEVIPDEEVLKHLP